MMSEYAKEQLVKLITEQKIKKQMSERTRQRSKGLIKLGLQLIKGLATLFAGAAAQKYTDVLDVINNVL